MAEAICDAIVEGERPALGTRREAVEADVGICNLRVMPAKAGISFFFVGKDRKPRLSPG